MKLSECTACGSEYAKKPGPHYYCSIPCRFWSKVDKSSGEEKCWQWTGPFHYKGYGRFKIGITNKGAHRIAYEFQHGAIPEGKMVCHKCDNPGCCNPAHLWIGTNEDNLRDRQTKVRQARGESSGKSKLTELNVLEILSAKKFKGYIPSLAKKLKVSESTIQAIRCGNSWKHIHQTKGKP